MLGGGLAGLKTTSCWVQSCVRAGTARGFFGKMWKREGQNQTTRKFGHMVYGAGSRTLAFACGPKIIAYLPHFVNSKNAQKKVCAICTNFSLKFHHFDYKIVKV